MNQWRRTSRIPGKLVDEKRAQVHVSHANARRQVVLLIHLKEKVMIIEYGKASAETKAKGSGTFDGQALQP